MGWARPTIRWAAIALNLALGLILGAFSLGAWLRAESSEPVEVVWVVSSIASLLAVVALLSGASRNEHAN
jgi:hypothetical protein